MKKLSLVLFLLMLACVQIVSAQGTYPPTVTISPISGEQSGDVSVNYVIYDNDPHQVTYTMYYRTNPLMTPALATVSIPNPSLCSPDYPDPSVPGSFIWDSATDVPGIDSSEVQIGIYPTDIWDNGVLTWSNAFQIDNNTTPTVTVQNVVGSQCGDVTINFTLADTENDTCTIAVKYQKWNGVSYDPEQTATLTPASITTGLIPSLSPFSIVWDSEADGFDTGDTAIITIYPYDPDLGAPDTTTAINFMCPEIPSATISTPVGEQHGNVIINYTVTDTDDSNNEMLLVRYRLSNLDSWQNASLIPNINPFAVGPTNPTVSASFVWDSEADEPGVDSSTVQVEITPTDLIFTGTTVATGVFHLDNNSTPVLTIDTPSGDQCEDVDLTYYITDAENDPCSINVYYQKWSFISSTWGPETLATTTGAKTNIASDGLAKHITWNAATDGFVPDTRGRIIIYPADADPGVSGTTGAMDFMCPEIPTATITTPVGQQSGHVTISYTVTDIDSYNNEQINIEYRKSGASPLWSTCTMVAPGTNPLNVGPTNPTYSGTFIWDSAADIPGEDLATVQVRIQPFDPIDEGTWYPTNPFHLDNNAVPQAQVTSPVGSQCGEVEIDFDLRDMEQDDVDVLIQYELSPDGISWPGPLYPATVDGPIADLITSAGNAWTNYSVIWLADFDGVTTGSFARIIITPDDDDNTPESGTPVLTTTIVFDCSGYPTPTIITPTSPQSGNITVSIGVTQDSCDSATLQIFFSDDGGTTWNPATLVPPVNPFDVEVGDAPYTGTFVWDSLADLGNTDQSDIMLRIGARESSNITAPFHWQYDTTLAFQVDNNTPPDVDIPLVHNKGMIGDIQYYLMDDESDLCSITLEFRTYNAGTDTYSGWGPATTSGTTTGLTSSILGTEHSIAWLIASDIGAPTYVQIRITPSDTDAGIADISNLFYVDTTNQDARAWIETPSGEQSGNVTLNYVVTDVEGDIVHVLGEFSEDAGLNYFQSTLFFPATNPFNVNTTPGVPTFGYYTGVIQWDSETDLGYTDQDDIRFQLIVENISLPETYTTSTLNFEVDNNEAPVVTSITTPTGIQYGTISIDYTLTDRENDICSIVPEFSIDGGGTWQPATGVVLTGLTQGNLTFSWNILADITSDFEEVIFKITPFDEDEGTPNQTSSFEVSGQPPVILNVQSDYDTPVPPVGDTEYYNGEEVTAYISNSTVDLTPDTRVLCTGYTAEGDAEISSGGSTASITFNIDTDSTLTWQWMTQYYLSPSVSPSGAGTATPAPGWRDEGSNATLNVTTNLGYTFNGWDVDGDFIIDFATTSQVITMDSPKNPVAYFTYSGISSLSVISEHGAPVPAVGVTDYTTGSSISAFVTTPVTGIPGERFECAGYTGEGDADIAAGGTDTSVTFSIDEDSTITWLWNTEYQMNTSVYPTGAGFVTPANGWYFDGDTASITATEGTGYMFAGWDIDGDMIVDSTDNPLDVVMDAPKDVTAIFELEPTDVTLHIVSEVTTATPAVGDHTYQVGDEVIASVVSPASDVVGEQFVCTGYEGEGDTDVIAGGTGTSVTFDIDVETTITWLWKIQYQLTASASPAAGGSVAPTTGWYDEGDIASVTATTNPSYIFFGWDIDGDLLADTTDNPISVTMDEAKTITAIFQSEQAILHIASDHGTPVPAVGDHSYTTNTLVTASVSSPVSGPAGTRYVCSGFIGSGDSEIDGTFTAATVTFTINEDSWITWTWDTEYLLNLSANMSIAGTLTPPNAYYAPGSPVQIQATPNDGYTFLGWDTNNDSIADVTDNPYTVTVNAPTYIMAVFDYEEIVHYTFDTSEEGWFYSGKIGSFDKPTSSTLNGALGINPNGSSAAFAFWGSPDIPTKPGLWYKATYTLISDQTDKDLVPLVRLRANQFPNFGRNWYTTIESYNGASTDNTPKNYDLYITPNIPVEDTMILSFDLLSFNQFDNLNAWIYCDEVVMQTISTSEINSVSAYEFNNSDDSWLFSGKVTDFDEAISAIGETAITLNPNSSSACYGFWMGPEFTVDSSKIYKADFTMSSTEADSTLVPQIRLRVTQPDTWRSWFTTIESNDGQSPTSDGTKTYSLIFDPQASSGTVGANLIFELMSFNPADNTSATINLESAIVNEVTIP